MESSLQWFTKTQQAWRSCGLWAPQGLYGVPAATDYEELIGLVVLWALSASRYRIANGLGGLAGSEDLDGFTNTLPLRVTRELAGLEGWQAWRTQNARLALRDCMILRAVRRCGLAGSDGTAGFDGSPPLRFT